MGTAAKPEEYAYLRSVGSKADAVRADRRYAARGGDSRAQALLRCDTGPDGGIKVRNFSVAPSAVGMARAGDDCLAAVIALLGTDPEQSDMDVSLEVLSVGTEVSFIVLLVPEDDEEDNDGDDGGDNGDNGGEG